MLVKTSYFAANYLENWKCISVLRSDGSSSIPPPMAAVRTTHTMVPGHSGQLSGNHGGGVQKEPQNWYVSL